MSLFEFFRQKQIKITPETQVAVRYLTAANVADLYDMATGDLLLVKRRITAEDAQWLLSYPGKSTVFTTNPETLEALDAQESLKSVAEMHIVLSICLDYLHFGETLFAFGRFPSDGIKATVPNVVCISPVHRQDVEMQLSINLDAISAALGLDATMEQTPPEQEVAEAAAPEEESNSKVFPSKNDLVRAAVKEEFESQFSIVKAEFSGPNHLIGTVNGRIEI